jgi:mRNA interferase MazF
MALQFPPTPGDVVICDFDTGFRPPEMIKRRLAVVVSPRLRHRDGLCTVVPLSTTAPLREVPYQCKIALPYPPPPPFSDIEAWAKADMLATVGFARLDLMRTGRDHTGKRKYLKMRLLPADLAAIRACMLNALGLG